MITQEQFMWGIISGSIVLVILTGAIVIFVAKAIKYKRQAKNWERQFTNVSVSREFLVEDVKNKENNYEKIRDELASQIPKRPFRKYILYYNDTKEVEVHAIIKSIGIAVISDVGQLNYKIKLEAELFDSVDSIGQEEED